MSDVDITSSPGGILRVSADTIGALDLLGVTLARDGLPHWTVRIYLPDNLMITATPHTEETAA